VVLSSSEEGGECWSGVDSGDEGYSLRTEGIWGERRVTRCDWGEARGSIEAWALVLSCGEEGGEEGGGSDSGDEGYSLWTEGVGREGWVTGCDQGGARGGDKVCGMGVRWGEAWAVLWRNCRGEWIRGKTLWR
jgi:hypothetical protein